MAKLKENEESEDEVLLIMEGDTKEPFLRMKVSLLTDFEKRIENNNGIIVREFEENYICEKCDNDLTEGTLIEVEESSDILFLHNECYQDFIEDAKDTIEEELPGVLSKQI
jgi:hypothetical protein